ncbi:hypothetical protein [Nitrosopumilus adriaticus]|nr:hypothetical protein [Nitrosopumilus adriaticus]
MIDFLIEYEIKLQKGMTVPTKSWNVSFDCMRELATSLAKSHEDNGQVLNIIKNELVGKCKHPKNVRDKSPNGQWYCINCNVDL